MKRVIIILAVMAANLASAQMFAMTFGNRTSARLPAEYQEVEYLESTGTQYIDTGYPIVSNQFTVVAKLTSLATPYMGVIDNMGGFHRVYTAESSSAVLIYLGSSKTFSGSNTYDKHTYILNDALGVALDDSGFYATTGTRSIYSLWIFGRNGVNVTPTYGKAIVYSCEIQTISGNKLIDFVPAVRKTDSVAGMYDLVNATFKTNAGTGTFTVGPDVD